MRVKNFSSNTNSNSTNQSYTLAQNSKAENSPYLEKINIKKFNSLSYEERLSYLEKNVDLKLEDPNEKYCICRRGDDTVNYMLMCEICKEWFHGMCLQIIKTNADKISQYICLSCSRRRDNFIGNYHQDFLNYKRFSWTFFLDFIEEGEQIPVVFEELDTLKEVQSKVFKWIEKASISLRSIFLIN
jgi:dihydroneopterin aldolase